MARVSRVSLALALSACGGETVLDVRMIHSAELDPAADFEGVRLRITDADTGDRVLSETAGAEVATGASAFVVEGLEEGARYVLALDADAPGACSFRGRAVGMSLPFVHREDDYSVSIQVGCADEIGGTRGPPVARVGHRVIALADGDAAIAGGATTAEHDPALRGVLVPGEGVAPLERFARETGELSAFGQTLAVPVSEAAAVETPLGVAVVGGIRRCNECGAPPAECPSSIQIGAESRSLADARCTPSVVALEGVVAVIGGSTGECAGTFAHVAVYDDTMSAVVQTAGDAESACRVRPLAVRLEGDRALVAGGAISGAAAELLETDASGRWRLVPVTDDAPIERRLPARWENGAMAYVPCSGGEGAVYISGGVDAGVDADAPLDRAWCYRDGRLQSAGTLPEPRARHHAFAVRGPSGSRLLLAGGTLGGGAAAPARLFPVDGCACTDLTGIGESLPEPTGRVFDGAARLADGAVLFVGGADAAVISGGLVSADPSALLFVPDLSR